MILIFNRCTHFALVLDLNLDSVVLQTSESDVYIILVFCQSMVSAPLSVYQQLVPPKFKQVLKVFCFDLILALFNSVQTEYIRDLG